MKRITILSQEPLVVSRVSTPPYIVSFLFTISTLLTLTHIGPEMFLNFHLPTPHHFVSCLPIISHVSTPPHIASYLTISSHIAPYVKYIIANRNIRTFLQAQNINKNIRHKICSLEYIQHLHGIAPSHCVSYQYNQ